MKMVSRLIAPVFLAVLLSGAAGTGHARVMMTGVINQATGFRFDILETATFTVDDWLSTPNLWWLTIENSPSPEDSLTVAEARVLVNIDSGRYPDIIRDGVMYLIGPGSRYLRPALPAGERIVVDNTLISGESAHMTGRWNDAFTDEVLRIGSLPEGAYTLRFSLVGKYSDGTPFGEADVDPITATIEIRNPQPPELVTPENGADNVVTVPRFSWQESAVSDFSALNRFIRPHYTVTLWKMFDESGATLTPEEAIRRVPVWKRENVATPFADFDPGTAREELVSGRRYCWQVQGFDGTGRVISAINDGRSDIWEFTVRFTPPSLNEPVLFFPLRFSWTPAQAGGGTVLYDIAISASQDFSRPYLARGLVTTAFSYPSDAPNLSPGRVHYLRIQTTDDRGIPIGSPVLGTFTVPTVDVLLAAPVNDVVLSKLNPTFRWQGSSDAWVVTVFREGSRWSQSSGRVTGNSWIWDGGDMERGAVYSWRVAPADERGEPSGAPSETWRFTVPDITQITLVSPVDQTVETAFPTFTWDPLARSDEQVSYVVEITTGDGAAVHSETVSGTSWEYPRTAPGLQYASRYQWRVRALRNGAAIGTPSATAWFVTPFTAADGTEPTLAEVGAALRQVLADYPQYSPFRDKTLSGIIGPDGPMTVSQFLELLNTYRIKSVGAK